MPNDYIGDPSTFLGKYVTVDGGDSPSAAGLNNAVERLADNVAHLNERTSLRNMHDTGFTGSDRFEGGAYSPGDGLYYLVEDNTGGLSQWSGEVGSRRSVTPAALVPQSVAIDPNTNRIVCLGAHATNMGSYSDDQGANWTVITDSTDDVNFAVWDDTNSKFIAAWTNNRWNSDDGSDSSWTSRTPGDTALPRAMVTYAGRTLVFSVSGSNVSVDVSTDGGTAWALSSNVITTGSVLGVDVDLVNDKFVIAIYDSSGTYGNIKYYTSDLTDGTVWALAGESRDEDADQFNESETHPTFAVTEGGIWVQSVRVVGFDGSTYHGIAISIDQATTWRSLSLRFESSAGVAPELMRVGDRMFLVGYDGAANYLLSTA